MDTLEKVAIDSLDANEKRFCISFPPKSTLLEDSIKRIGVIQPIILTGKPPYTIITGFRRIASALNLGIAMIPAIIMSKMDDRDALFVAIHDNLARGLNVVEKSHAVYKMEKMGFEAEEICDTMVLFGMGSHEKVRSTLSSLARSHERLKTFVVSRNLSLKNVDGLLLFDREEGEHLLALLEHIRTTEGSLREIIRMVALMRIKEGRIDFAALSGASTVDELRVILRKRIHPILTSLEERLAAARRRAALPPHVDIKVDPFFEKEYIDIGIRARGVEDVGSALEKLHKVLEDGSLGNILELTKG